MHAPRHQNNDGLVHSRKEWMEVSAITSISETCARFDVHGFSCANADDMHTCNWWELPGLQKRLYSFLLNVRMPFCLESSLRYRFHLCEWFNEDDSQYFAGIAYQFLDDIQNRVPPSVLFVVLRTFFNGWATSARFQQVVKVCLLCTDCEGFDAIEHYACCTFQWRAFAAIFRKPVFPCSLARFLGLNAVHIEDKIFHACHMYAVYSAVNLRRREAHVSGHDQVKQLLMNGHRTACLWHKGLVNLYRGVWNDQ